MRRRDSILSVEECRQLIGPGCVHSDEQIRELRDQLYRVAAVTIDLWGKRKLRFSGGRGPGRGGNACSDDRFGEALARMPEGARAEIEERAAVLEHDAGLDRDSAERGAIAAWLARRC